MTKLNFAEQTQTITDVTPVLNSVQTHSVPSVVISDTPNLPSVTFTDQEKAEIEKISTSLDPKNLNTAITFGRDPSNQIAQFSDEILKNSKNSDTGAFGAQLTSVVNMARSVNFKNHSTKSKIPVIGGLIDMVMQKGGDMQTNFSSVSAQIDTAVQQMDITQKNLTDRLRLFDSMHSMNLNEYRNFCKYKAAGTSRLSSLEIELKGKQESITPTTDPMVVQEVNDFSEYVKQLRKKVHDFDIAKMLCVQTAIELRMLQTNNRDLISQFEDIKATTIPLWKKQFIMHTSIKEGEAAAAITKNAKDFTNNLLVENAKILGQTNINIAHNKERALVDVSTLENVNKTLIDSFTKAQQIELDGRNRRIQDSAKIESLAGELRAKLIANQPTLLIN